EKEWHATLVRTLRMDQFIQKHSAIMDKYDPEKRVGLMVDEWGTWYDAEPGTPGSGLFQQNSLRDALVAALNFHIFHAHADRVQMAGMVLTPTYHVFEMYKVHQGATSIPVDVRTPDYQF